MSEWFDILKQQGRLNVGIPPAQPANPQTRRRGPPTAAEQRQYQRQRRQQQPQTPQQAVQGRAGAITVKPEQGNELHAQAKANPHPQYRNLGREEVTYLQQSGMTPAQIRNINNQASAQNQVAFGAAGQSLGRRVAAGAGNVALRGAKGGLGALRSAAGGIKQRLGQMVTPKETGATTNVTDPNNVTVQPNPQVIQQLQASIAQLKPDARLNPSIQNAVKGLEEQLQAEKNKGRPFSKPVAKSEWFNVLYSHQTM